MKGRAAFLLAAFASLQLQAATISGKVTISNATKPSDLDQVVIYVIGFNQPPPKSVLTINQKNKVFFPRVLPITRGQSVAFVNSDNLSHNVFSTSRAAEFDLGEQNPLTSRAVRFDKLGLVSIFCNIHPEMESTILVLPNQAFAKVDASGRYSLRSVRSGIYQVVAWHPLANSVGKKVDFGTSSVVNFEIQITKKAEPHLNKHGRPYKERIYQ